MKQILYIIASALLLASCGNGKNPGSTDDQKAERGKLLANYVGNYIIPAYNKLASELNELTTATDNFIAQPTEATLETLRGKYKEAYTVWQRVDICEMGSVEVLNFRKRMNTYPLTVTRVESNILSGQYDLSEFSNVSAQGFPALNYLLYEGDALAKLTTGDTNSRRKEYLKSVVVSMNELADKAASLWSSEQGDFIAKTGNDINSSTSILANAVVKYYEKYLRSGKVGLPVGVFSGQVQTELVESYYAPQYSKKLAEEALKAFKDFYNGKSFDGQETNQLSLQKYLANAGIKNADGVLTANVINQKLTTAQQKLSALNDNLIVAIQEDKPNVLQTYDAMQAIVPLIKIDLISALGVSITYVDNDGD